MLIPHSHILEMNKKNASFCGIPTTFQPRCTHLPSRRPRSLCSRSIFFHNKVDKAKKVSLPVICLLWRFPLTVNRPAGQVIFQSAHRITQVEILKMLLARKSENLIWQESARRLLPPSLKMRIKMMITMRFIDKSENLISIESAIRLLPPSLPVLPTYRIKKWTSPTTKVSLPGFHFHFVAFHNDDSFISRTIKTHMIRFLRPQEVFTMVLDCPLTFTLHHITVYSFSGIWGI